jgi:hypothetical protein
MALRVMCIGIAALVAVANAASAAPAPSKSAPNPAPAAASGPVAVPRTEFIATMDSEFRKMDADHNNALTKKEADDFAHAMLGIEIDNRRRALFAALDADHNGQLTAQEFARLEIPAPEITSAPLFAQGDLNHDGQVTLVEYRTAKLANFDRMDADKDGIVTPAEMKAAGLIK